MSQAKTVKQVLIAARWMIDNVGWCQGVYSQYPTDLADQMEPNPHPCAFCATGAIYYVVANAKLRSQAELALEATINDGNIAGYVAIWNDDKDRTKEQVLQAFDRAIEQA